MDDYRCEYCNSLIIDKSGLLCPECEMPHGLGGPNDDGWISRAYEDPRPWMSNERKRRYNLEELGLT